MPIQRFALILGLLAITAPCRGVVTGSTLITFTGTNTFATAAPGQDDYLYLAGREGQISIVDLTTSNVLPTPFLQIPDIDAAGEGGLLGLAFHPDYETNGKFYTYATVDNGGVPIDGGTSPFSSRIREYTRSAENPLVASITPKEVVSWVQPRSNHNGGWIGFNPDLPGTDGQYLYITSGDGGKQGDPDNNAQDLTDEFLGKILRVDVNGDDFPTDSDRNYAIPGSNPFVGVTGDDEIWGYGLRNPYRASFDRDTGDFWIGEVGQGSREEINQQLGDSPGGENYAWQRREGFISHQGGTLEAGDTEPVYDYRHGFGTFRGNSVTGGYVYRGDDASLNGDYFFADFSRSNYWKFDPDDPSGTVVNLNSALFGGGSVANSPISFAEDAAGNLYFLSIGGGLYRIDTTRPGDYDADGDVDADDYTVWSNTYGSTLALGADGNADGRVDAADYTVWRDALAAAQAGSAGVPEPSALVVSLLGVASLMASSRLRPPAA